MGKLIKGFLLTVVVSFFVFPAQFHFLPAIVNTKNLLAAIGAVAFIFDCLRNQALRISRRTLIAGIIAVAFSLWCLFSVTINGTDDTTYVDYWSAFLFWTLSAYATYFFIRYRYGYADLALVTKYLAIMSVAQCIIALMIDNIEPVKRVVDMIFVGGEYYQRSGRLYGIGCALDPAGCRFSAIQALIAHQIAANKEVRNNNSALSLYLIAFIIIVIVGSMISRTTLVGSALGLVYIVFSVLQLRRGGFLSKEQFTIFIIFGILLISVVFISIGLYRTSEFFRQNIRFGFEAFFNWAETGEFRTNSTDTLMNVMWIWPKDTRTWIIGSGLIGVFDWGTDIGYCNFVLYSGIIGLIIFSSYFLYCHLSLNEKFQDFRLLSLILVALTFIIWTKVLTDIFFIDALLFCIDGDFDKDVQRQE